MSDKQAAKAIPQMDWQQVALNGGPPCFYVEGPQYCGRAERWPGHGNPAFHDFVSLEALLAEATRLQDENQRYAKVLSDRMRGIEALTASFDKLDEQASRLREALEMIICHGCDNRIGFTGEGFVKSGNDWRRCPNCRKARAALAGRKKVSSDGPTGSS